MVTSLLINASDGYTAATPPKNMAIFQRALYPPSNMASILFSTAPMKTRAATIADVMIAK